ncbi:MAG: acyl carrier protein [Lachnospiraceae bacterium]|nr:acyl carrier protein [Lachnospiraceae bacterium]MCI8780255.1 acyl carrier protein [Lachnospiraceae bacterium]
MERIYRILEKLRPEIDFRNTHNYVSNMYLSSLYIVELITELENEFNISIDIMDVVPERFETVEGIADLVKKNGGEW